MEKIHFSAKIYAVGVNLRVKLCHEKKMYWWNNMGSSSYSQKLHVTMFV